MKYICSYLLLILSCFQVFVNLIKLQSFSLLMTNSCYAHFYIVLNQLLPEYVTIYKFVYEFRLFLTFCNHENALSECESLYQCFSNEWGIYPIQNVNLFIMCAIFPIDAWAAIEMSRSDSDVQRDCKTNPENQDKVYLYNLLLWIFKLIYSAESELKPDEYSFIVTVISTFYVVISLTQIVIAHSEPACNPSISWMSIQVQTFRSWY